MEVQVRHLLKCSLPDGVPQAEALIGKGGANSGGHAREGIHQGGASIRIESAHVIEMNPWNNERVARMELP